MHPVVLSLVGFSLILFGTTHVLGAYFAFFEHDSPETRIARVHRAEILGGAAVSLGLLVFTAWWVASRRWAVEDKK